MDRVLALHAGSRCRECDVLTQLINNNFDGEQFYCILNLTVNRIFLGVLHFSSTTLRAPGEAS